MTPRKRRGREIQERHTGREGGTERECTRETQREGGCDRERTNTRERERE